MGDGTAAVVKAWHDLDRDDRMAVLRTGADFGAARGFLCFDHCGSRRFPSRFAQPIGPLPACVRTILGIATGRGERHLEEMSACRSVLHNEARLALQHLRKRKRRSFENERECIREN
jgi:hypothetical protein